MMSLGKDYAPCSHCAANNITHRTTCWRCGHTLLYTVGSDGQSHANTDPNVQVVSTSDLELLLNQAVTIDLEGAKRKLDEADRADAEKAAGGKGKALLWLRRRIERHSGA